MTHDHVETFLTVITYGSITAAAERLFVSQSTVSARIQQLEEELNNGTFYKRMLPASDAVLWNIAQKCAETRKVLSTEFSMTGADGQPLHMIADVDFVDDELGDVKCILSIRKK